MAPMTVERWLAELHTLTGKLAGIVTADMSTPVPTCPGWTFRQLATHVGRGHRWAAELVATRATERIPLQQVPDGKLPGDPDQQAGWLTGSAGKVAEAVTAAGDQMAWTFIGMRPAWWWARRRVHETAVHLADAQLARGQEVELPADLAADGVDEWLALVAARPQAAAELAAYPGQSPGKGRTLHFHATDEGLDGTGEWLVTCTEPAVSVQRGHGKADAAVRGPALALLLLLTRRRPADDPAVEISGDQGLLAHWLEHTPF